MTPLAVEFERRGWTVPDRVLGRPFSDWEQCAAGESDASLAEERPATSASRLGGVVYVRVRLSVGVAEIPAMRDDAAKAREDVLHTKARRDEPEKDHERVQIRFTTAALALWRAEKRVEAGR